MAAKALPEHNGIMAEKHNRSASECAGRDRRRRPRALPPAQSARLFRRLQAVLRVAEEDSIAAAAEGAFVAGSMVHRGGSVLSRIASGSAGPMRPIPVGRAKSTH